MCCLARTSPGGKSSTRISPESGCKNPIRMLILVVFPAPFGPRKAQTSPGKTEKDTSDSAGISCPPAGFRYVFVTPRNSMAGVVIRGISFPGIVIQSELSSELQRDRAIVSGMFVGYFAALINHE